MTAADTTDPNWLFGIFPNLSFRLSAFMSFCLVILLRLLHLTQPIPSGKFSLCFSSMLRSISFISRTVLKMDNMDNLKKLNSESFQKWKYFHFEFCFVAPLFLRYIEHWQLFSLQNLKVDQFNNNIAHTFCLKGGRGEECDRSFAIKTKYYLPSHSATFFQSWPNLASETRPSINFIMSTIQQVIFGPKQFLVRFSLFRSICSLFWFGVYF